MGDVLHHGDCPTAPKQRDAAPRFLIVLPLAADRDCNPRRPAPHRAFRRNLLDAERQCGRRVVPRAKYTKPPGPLPDIAKIQRSTFRFRNNQRRALTKLLPARVTELRIPREAAEHQWRDLSTAALPERVKTI